MILMHLPSYVLSFGDFFYFHLQNLLFFNTFLRHNLGKVGLEYIEHSLLRNLNNKGISVSCHHGMEHMTLQKYTVLTNVLARTYLTDFVSK